MAALPAKTNFRGKTISPDNQILHIFGNNAKREIAMTKADMKEVATKKTLVEADIESYVGQFIRAGERNRAMGGGNLQTLGRGSHMNGCYSKTAPATPAMKDKRAIA